MLARLGILLRVSFVWALVPGDTLSQSCELTLARVHKAYQNEDTQVRSPLGRLTLYFDENTRAKYEVEVIDGLLRYRSGAAVHTNAGEFLSGGHFAVSESGKFFVLTPAETERLIGVFPNHVIHHSTLLAGAPARSVGDIFVAQGRIERVNDSSGHYAPQPIHIVQGLETLAHMGADLREVSIEILHRNEMTPDLWERLRQIGVTKIRLSKEPVRPLRDDELPPDAFLP